MTDGWVMSFTEDAVRRLAIAAARRWRGCACSPRNPSFPSATRTSARGCRRSARNCPRSTGLAREGYRLAMRGLLMLIAVGVARLAASHARNGSVTLYPADETVARLRALVDEFFRQERLLGFYAEKLGMTADRLNDHVKRATGVTAGHLIRQRVLIEAKRRLVFTAQPDPRHCRRAWLSPTRRTSRASSASRPERRRMNFATGEEGDKFKPPHRPMTHLEYWPCKQRAVPKARASLDTFVAAEFDQLRSDRVKQLRLSFVASGTGLDVDGLL